MAWILLLLALACFLVPFFTTAPFAAVGVLCVLAALVLVVIATMMLLAARVGSVARSAPMLSADELRVMREIADRQRARGTSPADPDRAADALVAPARTSSDDA